MNPYHFLLLSCFSMSRPSRGDVTSPTPNGNPLQRSIAKLKKPPTTTIPRDSNNQMSNFRRMNNLLRRPTTSVRIPISKKHHRKNNNTEQYQQQQQQQHKARSRRASEEDSTLYGDWSVETDRKQLWEGTIYIGRRDEKNHKNKRKPQPVPVVFDTTSLASWVIGHDQRVECFNKDASQTLKGLQQPFASFYSGGSGVTGTQVTDILAFDSNANEESEKRMKFGVVDSSVHFPLDASASPYCGVMGLAAPIIGLAVRANSSAVPTNFVTQIDSPPFSFFINRPLSTNLTSFSGVDGTLTIGPGVRYETYYQGTLVTASMVATASSLYTAGVSTWVVRASIRLPASATSGDGVVLMPEQPVAIDSTAVMIYVGVGKDVGGQGGGLSVLDAITRSLKLTAEQLADCSTIMNMVGEDLFEVLIPTNATQNNSSRFAQKEIVQDFSFSAADIAMQVIPGAPCLGLQPGPPVFGDLFLRRVYTVFDAAQRQMHFAYANHTLQRM